MPPKIASASADSATVSGQKLEVIRATLCRTDFKGVFIAVGEDLGLAQPKTASSLFRSAIAAFGLELKDGTVSRAGVEDGEAAAVPVVPATPTKRKATKNGGPTPKKAKTGKKGATTKAADEDVMDVSDEAWASVENGAVKDDAALGEEIVWHEDAA